LGEDDVGVEDLDADEATALPVERNERVDTDGRLGSGCCVARVARRVALVAGVLLAEYLALAFLAAGAGVAIGRLVAPLLIRPGAGMLGTAGPPPLSLSNVVMVIAVALVIAVLATFVTAVRAARTSTVRALADSARQPRRSTWLIGLSARLPAPLLLALQVGGGWCLGRSASPSPLPGSWP
jgi:hypothetical protein